MPTSSSARRVHRLARLVVLLCVAALAVAGCATHSPSAGAPPTTGADTFPVRVTPPGAPAVTVPARPRRIISLDPSSTEILYAVGAGSQVVAVDNDSDYPSGLPRTRFDGTKPNVEAIAGANPDLVVTGYDTNDLVASLAKVHIPVLLTPAPTTLDEAYAIWTAVGRATGHQAAAATLVATTRTRIGGLVAGTPKPRQPLNYYYELDQTLYTATSRTFIGQLFGMFGLTNVADPADPAAAGGYPQLSAEQIIATDPKLIFLADDLCCAQSAATVAARPGWNTISAVRNGNVVALNDDIASRWGPRVGDLMATVAAAVRRAETGTGG